MSKKSGYEGDQEEFWHPDGSGRRVSREVFERETAARQAAVPLTIPDGTLGLGRIDMLPEHGLPGPRPDLRFIQPVGRLGPAAGPRWVSLPLIGFGQRQSALHGQMEIFPQFYEADIEVSQVVGIAQVAEAEFQRHGAVSDVFLRFGGKVFCTLTRQQLRQRLGINVEEVAS